MAIGPTAAENDKIAIFIASFPPGGKDFFVS